MTDYDENGEVIRRLCLMCAVHTYHDECQKDPTACGPVSLVPDLPDNAR